MLKFQRFVHIRERILDIKNSLGVDRKDMPQIKSPDLPDFLQYLENNGVTIKTEMTKADKLKPIQRHIDLEKAETIPVEMRHTRPIIASKDGYILDGHHRWYNAVLHNYTFKIIRVSLTMKQLLDIAKKFPKVKYSSV